MTDTKVPYYYVSNYSRPTETDVDLNVTPYWWRSRTRHGLSVTECRGGVLTPSPPSFFTETPSPLPHFKGPTHYPVKGLRTEIRVLPLQLCKSSPTDGYDRGNFLRRDRVTTKTNHYVTSHRPTSGRNFGLVGFKLRVVIRSETKLCSPFTKLENFRVKQVDSLSTILCM